jgi:tol-pal system protein YbgF
MNPVGLTARQMKLSAILPGIVVVFALAMVGCGSAQEAMDEEFGPQPQVGTAAQLEFRLDSLMAENRKLRDQVEAVTAENRRLTARTAELETKVAEAMTAAQAVPQATPEPAPARPARPARPAPAKAPQPVAATESNSAYDAALSLFNARNYTGALEQFQALLNSGSAGKLADNCKYWIGESYYGLGKYSDALQAFNTVLEQKGFSKIPYALLMIGNCEAQMGNKDAAREAYSKVTSQYPTSPVAAKAQARLSKLR